MEHKEGNLEIIINQFYDATVNINKAITNMVKELEPGRTNRNNVFYSA